MKKHKQEHPEVTDIKNICEITPKAKTTKNVCKKMKKAKMIKK